MIMPRLSWRSWATIVSVVLLVVVVRIEEGRVARAHRRVGDYALQAANSRAERDSTRRVDGMNARVARVLGDSLRLFERLVVQKAQRQDELDRVLRRERVARYAMTVRADSLAAMARSVTEVERTETSNSIRRASFRIRQAPYTVAADVVLPESPDTGTMSVHVALDPLHVEARVSCAPADGNGIRPASVSASGPAWADIRFDRVEQSEELCASPALARGQRRSQRFPILLGTGAMLDLHGRVSWGLLIGVGYGWNR